MAYSYNGSYQIICQATPSNNNFAKGTTCTCTYTVGAHPDNIVVTSMHANTNGNTYYSNGSLTFRNSSGVDMGTYNWTGGGTGSADATLSNINSSAILACTGSGTLYATKNTSGNAMVWSSAGKKITLTVYYTRTIQPSTVRANSNIAFGETPSVTITKNSSMTDATFRELTHEAIWSVNSTYYDSSATAAVNNGATSATRNAAIPLTWCNAIPNATTCTCTVTLTTKYGVNIVGTNSATFTLSVPTSVVPTCTNLTYTIQPLGQQLGPDGMDGYNFYINHNMILQNMVGIKLNANGGSGIYGSTIVSYNFESPDDGVIDGSHYIIAKTGQNMTKRYSVTVTDSRNRTSQAYTVDIPIIAYQRPIITVSNVYRSGVDKNPEASGTWATVQMISSVDGTLVVGATRNYKYNEVSYYSEENPAAVHGRLEEAACGDIIDGEYILIGDYTGDGVGDMDVDHTWYMNFIVTDLVTSAKVLIRIVTAPFAIHVQNGGNSVAFGKIAEKNAAVEINSGWDFYVHDQEIDERYSKKSESSPMGGNGIALWSGTAYQQGTILTMNDSIFHYKILIFSIGSTLCWRPAWIGNYPAFGMRIGGSSNESILEIVANINFTNDQSCTVGVINNKWAGGTAVANNSASYAINGIYGIQ